MAKKRKVAGFTEKERAFVVDADAWRTFLATTPLTPEHIIQGYVPPEWCRIEVLDDNSAHFIVSATDKFTKDVDCRFEITDKALLNDIILNSIRSNLEKTAQIEKHKILFSMPENSTVRFRISSNGTNKIGTLTIKGERKVKNKSSDRLEYNIDVPVPDMESGMKNLCVTKGKLYPHIIRKDRYYLDWDGNELVVDEFTDQRYKDLSLCIAEIEQRPNAPDINNVNPPSFVLKDKQQRVVEVTDGCISSRTLARPDFNWESDKKAEKIRLQEIKSLLSLQRQERSP